jgi:hypothetical protein
MTKKKKILIWGLFLIAIFGFIEVSNAVGYTRDYPGYSSVSNNSSIRRDSNYRFLLRYTPSVNYAQPIKKYNPPINIYTPQRTPNRQPVSSDVSNCIKYPSGNIGCDFYPGSTIPIGWACDLLWREDGSRRCFGR